MTESYILFAFAVLLFGLGLYLIFRLADLSAQSAQSAHEAAEIERWWRERAEYRAANPPELSDSSLIDDYNSTLPEQREHDGGDRAA